MFDVTAPFTVQREPPPTPNHHHHLPMNRTAETQAGILAPIMWGPG